MIFFGKKRKHKLPKFPPFVRPAFESYCAELDSDGLKLLGKALQTHFSSNSAANDGPETHYSDKEARDVFEVCKYLLTLYPSRNPAEQKLIVGAVRYAASSDDPFCDHTFASGMTDDKQVINYVLEELKIEDRYLDTY